MTEVPGTRTFAHAGSAYDRFMGRYATPLATLFADVCRIAPGMRVLDVGCGPGALSAVAVERVGPDALCALDPTPGFVELYRSRFPGVDVRQAPAEAIPFGEAAFDVTAAQLVLHFVDRPEVAVSEMARVTRPGGTVAAAVWDFADGMELLRFFWDAALRVDPAAPDEARTLRFGGEHEITDLFTAGGLVDAEEHLLRVESTYRDVDELWDTLLAGIGPAGSYLLAQDAERRAAIRAALDDRLGRPSGPFTLRALARAARATRP